MMKMNDQFSNLHWITSEEMLFTSNKKYTLQFDKNFPLLINFYHFNTAHPISPNYHDFFEIGYFYSGEGKYHIGNKSFEIKPGTCVLVQPGQMHHVESHLNSNIQTASVYFLSELMIHPASLDYEKDYLLPFCHQGVSTVSFFQEKDLGIPLGEMVLKMREELSRKEPYYQLSLKNQLCQLLLGFLKKLEVTGKPQRSDFPMIRVNRLKRAFDHIHQNYQNEIHLDQLAQKSNMSSSYFCRYFKKITGISPNNYILRYRVDRSKELLANTDKSIAEIAYETGFNSQSYYDRIFQRHTRLSPTLFRQTYLNE